MSLMDETQQLEVESLAAIYGDDAVQLLPAAAAAATTSTGSVVQVRLPVDLGLETVVRLSPEAEGVAGALSELQLRLTHLPPVLLELLLPPAYPVSSPPQLVDARLPPDAPYCSATSLRQRLLALLARAYDESGRDLCLWAFLELVREGHFLDRSDEGAGGAVLLQPAAGDDVAALGGALSKHEASVLGQTFAETTFPCGICLENRKGAKCVEFRRCRHVLCVRPLPLPTVNGRQLTHAASSSQLPRVCRQLLLSRNQGRRRFIGLLPLFRLHQGAPCPLRCGARARD